MTKISTFIISSRGDFQVTFCSEGRSSNIIAVYKKQLTQLSQTGHVTEDALADMQPVIVTRSEGVRSIVVGQWGVWVGVLVGLVLLVWG